MKLKSFLKLVRCKAGSWYSAIPLAATIFTSHVRHIDLAIVPVFFTTFTCISYGFVVNNIEDRYMDKSSPNPAKNPISIGEVSVMEARVVSSTLFVSTLMTGLFLSPINTVLSMILLFLCHTYSAEPRVKTKPPLDLIWNMFIGAVPIAMGYLTYRQSDAALCILFTIGLLLCAVAELINQIVDYGSDTRYGIKTTATLIGRDNSVVLCILLTVSAFMLVIPMYGLGEIHWVVCLCTLLGGFPIVTSMIDVLRTKSYERIEAVYKRGNLIGLIVLIVLILSEAHLRVTMA